MTATERVKTEVWASNALFFAGTHVLALLVLWLYPPSMLQTSTVVMLPLLWNAAMFGITVGYHRLWSHRAFRAGVIVRAALAFCGSMGVQGSIKIAPHDPVHDPYSATRGMLFAHMGWIFFKPSYPRMNTIGREDLDRDPVVSFQHRHYVPIALFSGFVFPALLAALWGDALGGFCYGGIWMRIFVWHCTFCVNSLAHWQGLQPYTDEVTARGNTILAILTNGEGNHNFHAFPHDFRSGLHKIQWDPSQWLILLLHRFRLAWGMRVAREQDIAWAQEDMRRRDAAIAQGLDPDASLDHDDAQSDPARAVWTLARAVDFARHGARCLLVIDGHVVDATSVLGDHPGGAALLRAYAIRDESAAWREGHWAFNGGLNNHTRAAKRRVQELRVARLCAADSTAEPREE